MASSDTDPLARIDRLIAEERELRSRATGSGLGDDDKRRLKDLEQRLDQCWDLLRRRRANSEFGVDPDQARTRPVSEVESYQQ
ncbi:DUF2630 family protein [Saccharomonospora azurea]|uniref:DUF2630 family protein n=1 Tax=Saccharomonospora azurea NA-128 TaxID=882081 RepID=H8GFH4_9PSEU|nr:DUF2630 family protein [Saccharomonospora azurea]EHK86767.1 hypothetical protein SZMC14600_13289 [Saccharomonospora azurea SZMC 14600]EHY90036.1 Protein of unknown function (DUF2630) [Saccharomonospora azurea NA-128]